MRYLLPLLLLMSGCSSFAWGPRGTAYWERYVQDQRPYGVESVYFHPEGKADDAQLEADTPFTFKFTEFQLSRALWVIEVREDRTGYFVFHEAARDDKDNLHARYRKLDFELSAKEYDDLRRLILDSGFLSLRSNYTGDGDFAWTLGVRAGGGLKLIRCDGGYPNEPRDLAYGAYDLIVVKRTATMDQAGVLKDDERSAAFQPLR